MTNREHQDIRDALFGGMEPSVELRERFEKQVKILLDRRMTRKRVVGRTLAAVLFMAVSAFFGWAFLFVATAQDKGPSTAARVFMCSCFAVGCLAFLLGALYCLREIRSGLIAPRWRQQGIVFGSRAIVLMLATILMIYGPKLAPNAGAAIWVVYIVLVFWITATTSAILWTARWHHEDLLLEQKRTRLELAMLRDELTRKAPDAQ